MSRKLDDVAFNEISERFQGEEGKRLDDIARIVGPEFDITGPHGVVKDEAGGWRTATNEESLRVEFSGSFEFTAQGDEDLEENIAEQLDSLVERLQTMASDLRVKASSRE